jgi:hypothetical protein
MRRSIVALVTVCVLAPLALAACGSSGKSSQQKAQSQVCSAIADIKTQVDNLKSLTTSTVTVDAVKSDVSAISNDVQTIVNTVPQLASDKKAQVQAANQTFKTQVQAIVSSLTSNLSLSNAKTQLAAAVTALETSYKDTLQTVDCSSV